MQILLMFRDVTKKEVEKRKEKGGSEVTNVVNY